jgi:23S rRNA (uracil1939-C5)-methyltransferase
MVIFTTATSKDESLLHMFQNLLKQVAPLAQSVQWFENQTITDNSIPPVAPRLVLGDKFITAKIGSVKLSFSAHSFFQNNSKMTELIFTDIKKHVHGNTVDVCCGVGAITLFVADKASSIIGIEEVPAAIDLATYNAKQNNISHAKFFTAPMKKFLDYAPMDVDTIILDPPRGGLGKKVISKILAAQPATIVYMSCNPKSQYEDMQFLFTDGYALEFLQAYDFFPQTPHVETLAVFKRG